MNEFMQELLLSMGTNRLFYALKLLKYIQNIFLLLFNAIKLSARPMHVLKVYLQSVRERERERGGKKQVSVCVLRMDAVYDMSSKSSTNPF